MPKVDIPWLDVGPMLVFFAAFHIVRAFDPDRALFIAAGIFAIAALIALWVGMVKDRKLSWVLLVSTVAIVSTATLAVIFDSKLFLFMRPTVINGGIGVLALGGVILRRNVIQRILGRAIIVPDTVWTVLAIRWGLFFLLIAVTNEWVWRTQTEAVWVNFKTFGFAPMTLAFSALQLPLIHRHGSIARSGIEPKSGREG